jgi:hypothetical protein
MKKNILILVLLLLNLTNTKAQTNNIDIKNLEKITNMSMNEFEDWSLNKGLTYLEIKNFKDFDVVSYQNKNKYMISIVINKDGTSKGILEYNTTNNLEYINSKKDCIKFGYKFEKSEYVTGDNDLKRLVHVYNSTENTLTFYTSNKEKYYPFTIGIIKIR